MKKVSFILLLLVFISCKKDKIDTGNKTYSCNKIVSVEHYLVGKWELIRWSAIHYNMVTCGTNNGNTYNASDWNTNVILEVTPEGIFRTYKNDSLVDESFTHKANVNLSNAGYVLNCQQMGYAFFCLNNEDTIAKIDIGDTLRIYNPFLNINFTNQPNYSITWRQYYVKIE